MAFSWMKAIAVAVVGGVGLGLTGCSSLSRFGDSSTAMSALPAVAGVLHGGQQPVSGAQVQLYAANTTVSQGASTALLATPAVSRGDGSFSITPGTDYSCPAPGSLVYLVATGGNPGLPGTVNNTALAEMALLGTCSTLTAATFVNVNELTTVAAVQALAPFMTDYKHMGSAAANTGGLAGAFAGAQAVVSTATGTFAPPVNGVTQPTQLLNTLADILAACVNTAGGSAGDGTVCGNLETYAANGATGDTIAAMLHMTQLPAQNAGLLYGLITRTPPFQPYLGTAPADFTAVTVYSLAVAGLPSPNVARAGGGVGPAGVQPQGVTLSSPVPMQMAIDTNQGVWVYVPPYSVTENGTAYSSAKGAMFQLQTFSNGSSFTGNVNVDAVAVTPSQIAADLNGGVWTLNSNATLGHFNGPVDLYNGVGSVVKFPLYNGSAAGSPMGAQPLVQTYMTVDPTGNVWSNFSFSCYVEFGSNGSVVLDPVLATNPQCPPFPLYATPGTMASDEHGNVYMFEQMATVTNGGNNWTNGILKIGPSGNLLSPATGFTGGGVSAMNSSMYNMTFDRANDELWMDNNSTGIDVMKADGTAISGANGLTLPSGLFFFAGMAVDGKGNLWVMDELTATLHEFSPSGAILTPNGSGAGQSGLHPPGLSVPGPIGIDASGNIWVLDWGGGGLVKIPGLAAPKTYQ